MALGGPRHLSAEKWAAGDNEGTGSLGGGGRDQRLYAGRAGHGHWGNLWVSETEAGTFLRGWAGVGVGDHGPDP